MKYYRLNQIAMAVLGALLLFFGTRALIDIIHHEPQKPVIDIAGDETKKDEEKPGGPDIATLLAEADAAEGEQAAKKCAICHTFDKGGATLIGPNLYGVLGRKVAGVDGYEYSDALKGKDGEWDYAMIDHMIENPGAFAPGTKMVFPGLPDAEERADVILFLRSKSDSPPPLPEAKAAAPADEAAEAPSEAAPAEGGSEIIALIATADPAKGETDAALCKVCHTFDKGGATLVGPNLYDIVGKDIASHEGVTYTPALTAKEGDWTYENLDVWLTNPQGFASGTTMVFPGVADANKRANIIAFLRSNSDNPVPLPAAREEAPAAEPEAAPPEEEPAAEPEQAPAAEPEAAPPEEEPAAEPEEAPAAEPEEEPAAEPEAAMPEEAPAEAEAPADSEPMPSASTGEPPSPSQPQPVYPDEESVEMEVMETEDTTASTGEPPSPSQPQPVYPDGAPE